MIAPSLPPPHAPKKRPPHFSPPLAGSSHIDVAPGSPQLRLMRRRRESRARHGCGDAAVALATPLVRLAVVAVASVALVWHITKPQISREVEWEELARAAEARVSPAETVALAQPGPTLSRRRLAEESSDKVAWAHIVSGDEAAFQEGALASPSPRLRSSLNALPARFALPRFPHPSHDFLCGYTPFTHILAQGGGRDTNWPRCRPLRRRRPRQPLRRLVVHTGSVRVPRRGRVNCGVQASHGAPPHRVTRPRLVPLGPRSRDGQC